MRKSLITIAIAVAIALVGSFGLDQSLKHSGSSFAGTVENFPVLFQNGLQTGARPLATATDSLIRIGSRIASGNSSGTFIGLNANSGYAGDLENFQVGGTSKWKVDASGNLTAGGALAPASVTVGANGLDVTAAGALNLGPTTATSVVIGGTAVTDISTTGTTASTVEVGTTSQTGTITLGQSTASNTIQIGNANTATGATQTINIGAGTPVTTGLTTITIGNATANSNVPDATVSLLGKVKEDCGTGTASGNAVTIQKQCGVITSSTSNLAAATSETITLTDARIASTNIILATIQSPCTTGAVSVLNATAGSGSATIIVRNVNASSACASTYTVGFTILSQ